MSDPKPDAVPWVIFEKKNRSNARIVMTPSYPEALTEGAKRLGLGLGAVDWAPVFEGETAETAKKRVAGSIG